MCRQAIKLDIPEIGFSEHWDLGPYKKMPRFLQPEAYYAELERLRGLFTDQLIIRAGIEIAEPNLYPGETNEILIRIPIDYVLGSVHFVGKDSIFDENYFRTYSAYEVYNSYFAELDKMVRTANIDIVTHFDFPARTGKPILGYDPFLYEDVIHAILRQVIERGLTLDINTIGLRKAARILMPDPLILNWHAEMGGQRITFGSDAHDSSHIGLHFDKALATVHDAGITHITQFELRQACLLRLE